MSPRDYIIYSVYTSIMFSFTNCFWISVWDATDFFAYIFTRLVQISFEVSFSRIMNKGDYPV